MPTLKPLACLLIYSFALATTLAAPKKNVVLVVVDDLGRDLGCYGNKTVKTPNLDALAAAGTRFDYAYCTTSSCSASRSVILTGLHNHANGQYGHQHSFHNFNTFTSVRSLPVLLGDAGYRTARIGKFHVQQEAVYQFGQFLKGNPGGERNPVSMADTCCDFIAAKDERPFFLYFCTSDPHRSADVDQTNPHKPNRFGNGRKYEGVHEVKFDAQSVSVPPFLPDTPECRAELAEYCQSVARVDQGVGRLIQILKDAGHWEDTLFLFLSDNGMAFPGSKTTLYEPGVRLPLLVHAPGLTKPGLVNNALVNWADLVPTILEFTGAKSPAYKLHGRSFLPVLAQSDPPGWDEVYASHTFHEITMYYPMRVIRTRQYKLILNLAHPLPFPFASDLYESATWQGVLRRNDSVYGRRKVADFLQRPRYELYDLQADPHEINNLANDPAHAPALAELQQKLKAFQKRTDDPWLVKYQYE